MRILLLGGTTEAGLLARALHDDNADAIYSYAGRTDAPVAQPLPTRVGGFGGVAGLQTYLSDEGITHIIDATHPFAAQMSTNAVVAAKATGGPLLALERAPWVTTHGDDWLHVPDLAAAAMALGPTPRRVFLAIGRQHLAAFASAPQHHYLLRLVDPPTDLPLPHTTVTVARGPFTVPGDRALLRDNGIDIIVAKNAGGKGAVAKIAAARALGLPVIMIARPQIPDRAIVRSVADVMDWVATHQSALRGV
ncbi:MAG: cobalt-precorrin-6A reductase [Paracoccaceae bacterium]